MNRRPPPQRQRGIALITALLVVAIATVLAVEIAARERLDIRRTQNLIARDQAYDLALAAEAWALDILRTDLEDDNQLDGPQDNWAQPIMLPPFEGATLNMRLEDLQGRFNLNNLVNVPVDPQQAANDLHYKRFRLLLENLAQQHELSVNPQELIDSLADWLDPDVQARPLGAEDSYYMSLENPRRTANQLLASPTELLLVKGYTPELVNLLLPHVTALPESATSINLNTATREVLRSLDRRINDSLAERLEQLRQEKAWESVELFLQAAELSPADFQSSGLGVSSQYFAFYGDVSLGPARNQLQSLISRSTDGLRVLWRARGTL
ncbi:MAG TPA: type II secretion system minor pseudopilin GspK [Gammaproteobacteria bacterium]|nr:type II secretion system minor pseudopilin GspK [Gammaproteobacteria bacterium]